MAQIQKEKDVSILKKIFCQELASSGSGSGFGYYNLLLGY